MAKIVGKGKIYNAAGELIGEAEVTELPEIEMLETISEFGDWRADLALRVNMLLELLGDDLSAASAARIFDRVTAQGLRYDFVKGRYF